MVRLMILLLLGNTLYSQDCDGLSQGVFEFKVGYEKFMIERLDSLQLEFNDNLGLVYLNKIEKVSECEYNLRRYKIIQNEPLLPISMDDVLNVKVYKVEGNDFYITATLIRTSIIMEGVLTKIGDEVSDRFKTILELEK